jgi:hypothetical protein
VHAKIMNGNTKRAVSATKMNAASSRSHMLVTLLVKTTNKETGTSLPPSFSVLRSP